MSCLKYCTKQLLRRITVSVDDFRHAMTNLGDGLPNSEVDQMLQVGGVSGNRVDYRRWVQAMIAS